MQTRSVGCRDERQRLVGGRYGRHSGGRRFAPGEGVGIGCKQEGLWQRKLLMGGDRIEGKMKISRKPVEKGGAGGL